jgi:hypothetical protein
MNVADRVPTAAPSPLPRDPDQSIDGEQLRALLGAYWRIVIRKRGGGSRRRLFRWGLVGILIGDLFLGAVMGAVAFAHPDVLTYAVIVQAFTFFAVGMTVTAEAGQILFNAAEYEVLSFRPVGAKTLLAARSIRLFGYALAVGLALNLCPAFFGLATQGAEPWFPLAHLIATAFSAAFCACLSVFVSAWVLRVAGPRRLESMSSWAQGVLALLLAISGQVLPRAGDVLHGFRVFVRPSPLLALPPAWFAALEGVIGGGRREVALILAAVVGIAVTAMLATATLGKMARTYAAGIGEVNATRARPLRPRDASRSRLKPWLAFWLRDPVERGAFMLAAAYLRRDSEVRARLIPSFSNVVMFPLLAVIRRNSTTGFAFLLLTTGILVTVPLTVLAVLRRSSQFAAAVAFASAPLSSGAAIFHGTRKAGLYYLFIPALLFCMVFFIGLAPNGVRDLPLAIPGLLPVLPYSLLPALRGDYLPLARASDGMRDGARNLWQSLLAFIVMGIIAGGAWFANRRGYLWWMIAIEAALVAGVHVLMLRWIASRPMPPLE